MVVSSAKAALSSVTNWNGRLLSQVWSGLGRAPLALTAIVLVALAARLALAWQPIETVVAKLTPDDAYYYLQLARNVVRGQGPSLDGVNATNGFHPLWVAFLLPLAGLGRDAFLHAALSLGAVVGTLSVIALWWAMEPLTSRPAIRIVAISLYAFNTAVLFSAANGMESSVSLLSVIVLLGLFLRARSKDAADARFWILFGVVSGLAVLSRTDNGVYVLAMLAFLVPQQRFDPRPVLVAGGSAVMVTLPWFAWNLATFGTLAQSSGEAPTLPLLAGFDPDGTRSFADHFMHGAGLVKSTILYKIPDTYFFAKPLLGVVASISIIGSLLAARSCASARALLRGYLPILIVPAGAFLVLVSIHAGYRWFVQTWYFLIAVPIAALFLALALEAMSRWFDELRISGRQVRYAGPALALIGLITILAAQTYESLDRWSPGQYYWQGDMLAAASWVREQTPTETRVAGMNVGVIAYFGERQTANLDGVVNDGALDALKERRLLAYVDQLDPHYVIDYDGYLFTGYGEFWGADIRSRLTLVAEFRSAASLPFRAYRFE